MLLVSLPQGGRQSFLGRAVQLKWPIIIKGRKDKGLIQLMKHPSACSVRGPAGTCMLIRWGLEVQWGHSKAWPHWLGDRAECVAAEPPLRCDSQAGTERSSVQRSLLRQAAKGTAFQTPGFVPLI